MKIAYLSVLLNPMESLVHEDVRLSVISLDVSCSVVEEHNSIVGNEFCTLLVTLLVDLPALVTFGYKSMTSLEVGSEVVLGIDSEHALGVYISPLVGLVALDSRISLAVWVECIFLRQHLLLAVEVEVVAVYTDLCKSYFAFDIGNAVIGALMDEFSALVHDSPSSVLLHDAVAAAEVFHLVVLRLDHNYAGSVDESPLAVLVISRKSFVIVTYGLLCDISQPFEILRLGSLSCT